MHIKPYLLPVLVFLLVGPGVGVLTVMLVGADGAPVLPVNLPAGVTYTVSSALLTATAAQSPPTPVPGMGAESSKAPRA